MKRSATVLLVSMGLAACGEEPAPQETRESNAWGPPSLTAQPEPPKRVAIPWEEEKPVAARFTCDNPAAFSDERCRPVPTTTIVHHHHGNPMMDYLFWHYMLSSNTAHASTPVARPVPPLARIQNASFVSRPVSYAYAPPRPTVATPPPVSRPATSVPSVGSRSTSVVTSSPARSGFGGGGSSASS